MNREAVDQLVAGISETAALLKRSIKIMEVCGTHTVSLFRSGVKSLLPQNVEMLSGPGCPVCVTSQGYIDAACDLAVREGVVVCTYGDMVRVPGKGGSLESRRARGANVQVVYSVRDALKMASDNPKRKYVFLAIGFETTAPATAAAVMEADRLGLKNFFVMTAHKLVVPAMELLLAAGEVPIDGFLCPGHVSVVIGADAYLPVVERYHKPCVVAGFEPRTMLEGIACLLHQIAAGECKLENVYSVAVEGQGNTIARRLLQEVFVTAPARWRAMGELPASGQVLADKYARFDALNHFGLSIEADYDPPGCLCGDVIQGKSHPDQCHHFGRRCTPMRPIGPCMVSSEGTCAAWYKYNR